ncbi:restriction endonuclease subunit S [Arhodomonas sp. AD133]|uniref:restriction endonuclease subunit S n=1 Tax=Arhodomonas sp. AD133 TaxID=3415009 RepID=UPI003EBA6FEE
MSTEHLITEHLDLWTSAVTYKNGKGRGNNGEPKLTGIDKLRELILELAVRGKLVPQDPEEEPASKLLERIEKEKERLHNEGKIRRPKRLSFDSEDKPFELPATWKWTCLGEIGQIVGGGTPKSKVSSFWASNGIKWLTPADLYGFEGKYVYSGRRDISQEGLDKSSATLLPAGSVLFSSRAPIGYVAISGSPLATNQGFKSCVPYLQGLSEYLFYFLKRSAKFIDDSASGTTFREISGSKMAQVPVALPPLEEQERIVETIDELMALCDRLEQQTCDQFSAHETLVDTLLDTLTRSQDAAELPENWARLVAHFDTLFTTEHSIDRLKQTIHELAVKGLLVPQDPNDEPASKLLARTAAEKERMTLKGGIRKSKALPGIREDEIPFKLPVGWSIARLDDITEIQSGIAKGKKHTGSETVVLPYLRVANVQRAALLLDQVKEIEIAKSDMDRYLVLRRDLLITEGGDWDKVGRTAIWNGSIHPIVHQNHVFRARLLLEEQNERWIEEYLNSRFAREYFAESSKQTTNLASINKTQLRSCTVPIPPIQEQERILERSDELMALCDRLKSRLKTVKEIQQSLADTIVKQAVA